MTKMLASVNSVDEALLALAAEVDIIDLKQPERGALGALDTALVEEIVGVIDRRRPVSATIGDLPMQPQLIADGVADMAATGVDYVKIGFFPGGDTFATIEKLSAFAKQGAALIAVLFADQQPEHALLPALKTGRFAGVMLDTADKSKGSLTQLMTKTEIEHFVTQAKSLGLLCGLAGSLRQRDVAELLLVQPDYLGFRGALCVGHERTARLSREAIARLRQAFY